MQVRIALIQLLGSLSSRVTVIADVVEVWVSSFSDNAESKIPPPLVDERLDDRQDGEADKDPDELTTTGDTLVTDLPSATA